MTHNFLEITCTYFTYSKHKIRQYTVHRKCTVYTEITCSDSAESHQPHTKSHQLRTMNACGHINSIPWLYVVTSTPFHECTQFVNSVKSLQFNQRILRPIAYIHGTDLMRFGRVTLRSTKISIKWLWPIKVTLEVTKRHQWFFVELPLKWDSRHSSLPIRIEWVHSRPSLQMSAFLLRVTPQKNILSWPSECNCAF